MINISRFSLKKDGTPYKSCFCRMPELIENYDKAVADSSRIWHCHHRLETHNSDGERRLVDISREELIALDMYWNRPPEELIFLTSAEHNSLHNKGKKHRPVSDETKRKMSEAHKRQVAWNKGTHESGMKGKHYSEESKRKMSEAHKGQHKGMHWKLVDGKRVWY